MLLEWLDSHSSNRDAVVQEVVHVLPTLTVQDPLHVFLLADYPSILRTAAIPEFRFNSIVSIQTQYRANGQQKRLYSAISLAPI